MRLVSRIGRPDSASRARAVPPGRLAAAAFSLLWVIVLASCTSTPTEGASPTDSAPGESSMQLKVMEFNIEYGGEEVDFDSVIETIRASDADVVGIEEAYAHMPRIAEEVGWDYYDARLQIVSRYPLLAPAGSDGLYTYVAVAPGRAVAIGNVHLPSTGYGPFQVNRHDAEPADVAAIEERKRVPAVEPSLEALAGLAEQGVPSFLVGDFNAPSHLDWTEEAVGVREHVKYAMDWPVSVAVEDAGFRDSYREVHPDPVADPGLTWPAARPVVKGYNPGLRGAEADRIDFVYAAGPSIAKDSVLVGEEGGQGVEIAVEPWPTDHRATVSTFEVEPAELPTLVAVEQRLVEAGDEARVTYHAPGEDGERVAVVAKGKDPGTAAIEEQPTGEGSPTDGTLAFSTRGWDPGDYEAVLLGASGEELARAPIWVSEPGAGVEIDATKPAYRVGDPIEVEWHAAPGNRFDWVGVYKRGADPNVAYYILWLYTGASVDGSFSLGEDAHGPWPLKAGKYSVYLLEDDSYDKLAGGNFTVRG